MSRHESSRRESVFIVGWDIQAATVLQPYDRRSRRAPATLRAFLGAARFFPARAASDHRPVCATLDVPRGTGEISRR